MDTEKPSNVGLLFTSTIFLCALLWGIGAFFNIGFFTNPDTIDIFSKVLVGVSVAGFFLFILLDKTEPELALDL